jgi:very-short-patch-repair endonuclease
MVETVSAQGETQTRFLQDICAYFRDFLDTDFKRQAAPKRNVTLKDPAGNLTGIDAAKYPDLANEVWRLLRRPISENPAFSLSVPRGKYRGRLRRALRELIEKHGQALSEDELNTIADRGSVLARRLKQQLQNDLEAYAEAVTNAVKIDLVRTVAVPLVTKLEASLERARGDAFEAIYNIEEELGERLTEAFREPISSALATALVDNSFEDLDKLLLDVVDVGAIRQKLDTYFDTFTTTDFFQELHELASTLKIRDNFETYLYIGELRFNRIAYPLFYLTLSVELEERIFRIAADPHLYINKKAIEFAAQEISRETGMPNHLRVDERIVYLEPGDSFVGAVQHLLDGWMSDLAIPPLDFGQAEPQRCQRSQITVTNALHFAAFDKSDEAMLNDYEELMGLLRTDEPVALDFSDIVLSFLTKDPVSLEDSVGREWEDTAVDDRLVFASPVPLNEEQRKILSALRGGHCRFLAIEGPPGCGKSHTIVAIVFEAILTGRNVLVLSDKKEALDVVEDKLTRVLNAVRADGNFQNPILRLGKAGNTYGKILNAHSLSAINAYHQVGRANAAKLQRQITEEEARLKRVINELTTKSSDIDLRDVAGLARREAGFGTVEDLDTILADPTALRALEDMRVLAEWLNGEGAPLMRIMRAAGNEPRFGDLARILEFQPRLAELPAIRGVDLRALSFFTGFAPRFHDVLATLLRQYHSVRKPIVGYLFTRTRAREIDSRLGEQLPCQSALEAHKKLQTLIRAAAVLSSLRVGFGKVGIAADHHHWAYQQFIDDIPPATASAPDMLARVLRLREAISQHRTLMRALGVEPDSLDWAKTAVTEGALVARLTAFAADHQTMCDRFIDLPEFDYVGDKSRLESLHTERLAHTIDGRVVEFANEHRNLARALRDIIRKRQRFPREEFEHLKKAFPCMIAGIRDYAEYVPLERGLFDLVIIDEASQVSIAQAFPAFVRAKQLVVLGDQRQFSNVKTANASRDINTQYLQEIIENFRRTDTLDSNILNRLRKFDIKVSVLEFVERISNYNALLKKHFRGYPELISFSSDTFYRGQLQAVKIRGKRIEDVIRFTPVEHDGRAETRRNTNIPEAEAILGELRDLANLDSPPSVGIITPHTEQQALLVQMVNRQEDAELLNEALDLKIMTFDTCQGEERDVILYSMVATKEIDKLSYIFPRSLDEADEVDHVLRLQRLNVGFSRAKERVHFFLSKPIEEYAGSIGKAIQHFKRVQERGKKAPDISATDPKSPMETKVLSWLRQTKIFQKLGDHIEIDAQFEIGEYLRQLDPTYRHPAYKVDFLMKISGLEKNVSIIIEYDGFKEHFTDLHEVDALNYDRYMKAEDVERQKVLESYGYRFLRINRFNLGKDPVRTLDERLIRIAQDVMQAAKPHAFVETVKEQTNGLTNGDRRQCSVCGEVKLIEQFRDMNLARGYGRKCQTCKRAARRKRRR